MPPSTTWSKCWASRSETADTIVKYRKEHGNFEDYDGFAKVPGLDLEKLEKKRDAISF